MSDKKSNVVLAEMKTASRTDAACLLGIGVSFAAPQEGEWRFNHRGLAYWTLDELRRVYLGTGDGYLISLDAGSGRPAPGFGHDGRVDLTKRLSRPVERWGSNTMNRSPCPRLKLLMPVRAIALALPT